MAGFLTDLRSAFRSLRRSPATAALVTLTLGLGIAAATVIFSAVEGVLINPLRLDDADRYVTVYRGGREQDVMVSPSHELAELWLGSESFEQLEPSRWARPTLTGLGPALPADAMRITGTFHQLLGLSPALGRTFTAEETRPGGPDVALLSHAFWRERFGGRRDVLGDVITLDGTPHEVIGVMPRGFSMPASLIADIRVWLPYRPGARAGGPTLTGKLKEGVTPEQAEAELETLMAGHPLAERWRPRVVGAEAFIGAATRGALRLLMAAVAVLLLIATINVANLLLGRAHARTRETAVRAALGAGRGRIARQLLLESVILGLVAGAAGVLLAIWGLAALQAFRPENLAMLDRVTLNINVLGFAGALSLATSVLFGVAPAAHAASAGAMATLRSGQRLDTGSIRARRFRLGLVVAEVALSIMLLVGAGLLVRTVAGLYRADPGFQAEGLVRADLQLPRWKYDARAAREALNATLADRLRAVPGVAGVAQAGGAPPRTGIYFGAIEVEGRDAEPAVSTVLFGTSAGPDYFRVLRQPIIQGRAFTEEEARTGADVFVVGRGTAERYWGAESPVGSRIRLDPETPWHTVIGVAEDAAINGLGNAVDLQIYTPGHPADGTTWLIRGDRSADAVAAAVRAAIHEVDLDLAVDVSLVTHDLRASVGRQRFIMVLLIAFAAVATSLAAVGFYGVLSHLVTQRRREIGIRVSLGADRASVMGLIVRQGGAASAIGIALGLPAAFAASTLVAGQLHGVSRGDVPTYAAAAALLLATGLLASWLPARRALAVDPMEVIREE